MTKRASKNSFMMIGDWECADSYTTHIGEESFNCRLRQRLWGDPELVTKFQEEVRSFLEQSRAVRTVETVIEKEVLKGDG